MDEKQLKKRRKRYTREFYRGNKGTFVIALFSAILMSASSIMISWIMQLLIDFSTGTDQTRTLGELVLLSVFCCALLGLGYFLAYHSTPRFITKAIGQYKNAVFTTLSRKNISAFSKESTATYSSALSNDAATIENGYLSNLIAIAENLIVFAGALGLMLYYSPLLTAIGAGLTLLPMLASLLAGGRVARAERALSDRNEAYMATLGDCLNGFSVVKSFRAEQETCNLFARRIAEVSAADGMRRKMQLLVAGLGNVSGCIAQVGVFIVGTYMAVNGMGVSGGVVIAFVNLMNFVINPIASIPGYWAQYKAANALIDKIAAALSENVREEDGKCSVCPEKDVVLQNVSFSYDGEKEVLHSVSAEFEAGKKYAVVGGSGSGKSTLLNLLMAGHNGYTGKILLGDTELRDVSCDSLYDATGIVQQNVFVFNASIRENITMFRHFPDDRVDEAIRLSGLSSLIRQRGADYLCGENGCNLSGGEKQRISIARSLLKESKILLVDEATASLDAETAYQVSTAILDLDGITRIVVTHSLDEALLKRYDGILTLKNGSVVESGTFDELMEQKGYFYSLFTVSQ